MKILKLSLITLITIVFSQCKTEPKEVITTPKPIVEQVVKPKYKINESAFPAVQNSTDIKQTVFVPTLETLLNKHKNGIYGASLLLAWDAIRNEINQPISKIESKTLIQMNASDSYKNILHNNEYDVDVKVDSINGEIEANARFGMSLPFDQPFSRQEDELKFSGKTVPSFGFSGEQMNTRLLYYRNDDDFSLALTPRNYSHRIILLKCNLDSVKTLRQAFDYIKNSQNRYEKEPTYADWKSWLLPEDKARIPIVGFNIEHSYNDLIGSSFYADNVPYIITKAKQKTAFVLNEKGAVVEDGVATTVESASEYAEEPRPKKLFFDKPYFIFLEKRSKDKPYPYFALFVVNSEFMEK